MKRFRVLLASAVVTAAIAGCGGGIEEGVSTEGATASGQPAGFQDMMEQNAKNMTLKGKGRPKNIPGAEKKSP